MDTFMKESVEQDGKEDGSKSTRKEQGQQVRHRG